MGFLGFMAIFYLAQLIWATIHKFTRKPKTVEELREEREKLIYMLKNFFTPNDVARLNQSLRYGMTTGQFIACIVYISLAFNGPVMFAGLALGAVAIAHSIAYYKSTINIESEAWFQTSKWEKGYFFFQLIVGIPYLSYWLYAHIWPK